MFLAKKKYKIYSSNSRTAGSIFQMHICFFSRKEYESEEDSKRSGLGKCRDGRLRVDILIRMQVRCHRHTGYPARRICIVSCARFLFYLFIWLMAAIGLGYDRGHDRESG